MRHVRLLLILAVIFLSTGQILAQSGGNYDVEQYVLADAGEFVGGGAYQVGFTVGQGAETPVIGGGNYQVVQGYWAGAGFHEAKTQCGVSTGGNTFDFALSAPVYITVTTPGDLDCLAVELVNGYSHPHATSGLQTGRYWTIRGTNSGGDTASGFELDMTLPASFTPDADDKVCRYTGSGVIWDCGTAGENTPGPSGITRVGIQHLSEWAVGNDVSPTEVTLHGLRAYTGTFGTILMVAGGGLAILALMLIGRRTRGATPTSRSNTQKGGLQ